MTEMKHLWLKKKKEKQCKEQNRGYDRDEKDRLKKTTHYIKMGLERLEVAA